MAYQLIDNIRGVVLQEFPDTQLAAKALERQSCEADVSVVESPKPTKQNKADVKEKSD
jgi:hypothetical protein|tara:strand:+ start:64 stop:237 length:174 start_codon:yes stop_codon:yes gene_type:complete